MLFAKHYLYNQKLNQIEPELNEFNSRLDFKYRIALDYSKPFVS